MMKFVVSFLMKKWTRQLSSYTLRYANLHTGRRTFRSTRRCSPRNDMTNRRFHGIFLHPEDMLVRCIVDPVKGCWLWTGTKLNHDGYARIKYQGRLVMAHILSYELKHGPVPVGLELDHVVCSVRHCIHPDHTKAVTHFDNCTRQSSWWSKRTHCVQGHEFTPENTRLDRHGTRHCRTCRAFIARQWRKRKIEK